VAFWVDFNKGINIANIKEILIGFVTSDGSRHEFELKADLLRGIQITKKASSASPQNGNSPQERFSHEHLTVKEVAERLRVHPWTIYMWARKGRLPCIRLAPHSLRFLKSDIDKFERQHTSGRIR
jgi:excisionase family DNA binding protein